MAKKSTKSKSKSPKHTTIKFDTTKWDWYWIGGLLFAFWALANTYFAVAHYGFAQGQFWWFGNLTLFAVAWGLCNRQRGWLIAALSLSAYTTTFWVIDHVTRLFFGKTFLGLTAYLYTPGMGANEFLLAHYHYFTVPVCVLALYFMGKKKSNALWLVEICTPVVLLVSYFAFPAARNVNCVHTSCFAPVANWTGVWYSVLFCVGVFAAHLGATWWFENAFSGMKRTTARARTFKQAFAAVACLALLIGAWDFRYKSQLPHLACAPDSDTGMVQIGCDFTREHVPGTMVFGYKLKNKTNTALICQTRAKTQYNEFVLSDRVRLMPNENRQMGQVLPNPDVSVNVALSAICEPTSDRGIASVDEAGEDKPVTRNESR